MEWGLTGPLSGWIIWYLPLLHPVEQRCEGGSCPEVKRCLWRRFHLLLFPCSQLSDGTVTGLRAAGFLVT